MKKQIKFIEQLFGDFIDDCRAHMTLSKWEVAGDKNWGKTAIKRKITVLRQELLNLSKEIDKE